MSSAARSQLFFSFGADKIHGSPDVGQHGREFGNFCGGGFHGIPLRATMPLLGWNQEKLPVASVPACVHTFCGLLNDMIETKQQITINTDGISDEQKATPKFQSAYREMLAQLSAPGFITVLCAHEVAHLIYFTVAGTQQYEAHFARLRYDHTIDDYVGSLAGVQILDLPEPEPGKLWEWFSIVACAHVAGGVVARKLMPSSDGGDQDDKERFKKLCDELDTQNPGLKTNFDLWWKKAQEVVSNDLANPKFMEAIQKHAREIRPQLGL